MCETESRTFYFAAGVVVCLMVLPASAVAADRLRDRYLDRVNEAEARAVEAAKLLDDAEVLKRLERNAAVPHLSMETAIETSALVKIVKIRRLVKAKPALRKLVERTRAVLQESTRLGVRSHAIMPEAVVESVAENAILSLELYEEGIVGPKRVFAEMVGRIRTKIKSEEVSNSEIGILKEASAENIDELLALVGNEKEETAIRVVAVQSLAELGGKVDQHRLVDMLEDAIAKDRPEVVRKAIWYLSHHGRGETVDQLVDVLEASKNSKFAPDIVQALGRLFTRGELEQRHLKRLRSITDKTNRDLGQKIEQILKPQPTNLRSSPAVP